MGCGASKSADISSQQSVTVEQACQEIHQEFGVDEAKARKMAMLADKNGDGQIDKKILDKVKKDLKKILKEVKDKQSEDGTISTDDAVKLIKSKFPKCPDETVQDIVQQSDKDDNDRISAEELATLVVCTSNMKAILSRRFKELDQDNSGALSSDELTKLLVVELSVGEAQAKIYIWVCDKDKDTNINLEEFMKMWSTYFT